MLVGSHRIEMVKQDGWINNSPTCNINKIAFIRVYIDGNAHVGQIWDVVVADG